MHCKFLRDKLFGGFVNLNRRTVYENIENYCKMYDVPIEYLVDVISDLKVIPMIRGKGFEFSISMKLRNFLPKDQWRVENLNINAQQGIHDIDVNVLRLKDNKSIRVECKLSKNDSFKNNGSFKVKCMRSRTFSNNAAATRMATNYGVQRDLLLMHADSYRESDFDFVFSTLGNSFWKTIDGEYTFAGTRQHFNVLNELFPSDFSDFDNFKDDAFNFVIYSRSIDLISSPASLCRKRKCIDNGTNSSCGFIPNYPNGDMISISKGIGPWKRLNSNITKQFNEYLD
jgi:hypothetical protein